MKKTKQAEILNIDGTVYRTRLSRKFRNRTTFVPADPLLLTSIIPGTILDILV
ncbi:MAG: acetyl-CoA carboxylase biotin carboxyl carrier protein subunit, partial [Bacteroidales bacterium]|nr:acetyl-CoA carboxylase biotin carboxyl carrier protein subunit [Bacteroidales bacterium]